NHAADPSGCAERRLAAATPSRTSVTCSARRTGQSQNPDHLSKHILQPRQWEALQGAALCAVKNLDFFVLRSPLLELLQMRFSAEVARIGAAVRVRPKRVRAVHIEPQQHNAGCAQVAQAVQSQDAAIAAAAECVGLDLLDAGNLVRAELPSCETMS